MSLGASLMYPVRAKPWVGKMAVATLIYFIPIIGWFLLLGYTVEVIRQVSAGNEEELPSWAYLWNYFVDGLVASIGLGVYYVPPLLILFGAWAFAVTNQSTGSIVLVVLVVVAILLIGYPLVWVSIGGLLRFSMTGQLSSFFGLAENLAVFRKKGRSTKRAIKNLFVGFVVIYVVQFLLLIPFITLPLVLLMFPYPFVFAGHVLGRLAKKVGLVFDETLLTSQFDFWEEEDAPDEYLEEEGDAPDWIRDALDNS